MTERSRAYTPHTSFRSTLGQDVAKKLSWVPSTLSESNKCRTRLKSCRLGLNDGSMPIFGRIPGQKFTFKALETHVTHCLDACVCTRSRRSTSMSQTTARLEGALKRRASLVPPPFSTSTPPSTHRSGYQGVH